MTCAIHRRARAHARAAPQSSLGRGCGNQAPLAARAGALSRARLLGNEVEQPVRGDSPARVQHAVVRHAREHHRRRAVVVRSLLYARRVHNEVVLATCAAHPRGAREPRARLKGRRARTAGASHAPSTSTSTSGLALGGTGSASGSLRMSNSGALEHPAMRSKYSCSCSSGRSSLKYVSRQTSGRFSWNGAGSVTGIPSEPRRRTACAP
eukprot:scaffold3370_cov359-Prasinococcus_capsulatus_cf.AAC.7